MLRFKSLADIPQHLRQQLDPQPDPQTVPRNVRHKYHNTPVTVAGQKFPSKAQAAHNQTLRLAAASGEILGFVSEVSVRLPGGNRMRLDELVHELAPYTCSHCGGENLCPTLVFEDVKGVITEAWEVKRKALEAALGIKVRIISKAR